MDQLEGVDKGLWKTSLLVHELILMFPREFLFLEILSIQLNFIQFLQNHRSNKRHRFAANLPPPPPVYDDISLSCHSEIESLAAALATSRLSVG
jgi:hypothetical protein